MVIKVVNILQHTLLKKMEKVNQVQRKTEGFMMECSSVRQDLSDWKREQRDWEIQFNDMKQLLREITEDIHNLWPRYWKDGPDND